MQDKLLIIKQILEADEETLTVAAIQTESLITAQTDTWVIPAQ